MKLSNLNRRHLTAICDDLSGERLSPEVLVVRLNRLTNKTFPCAFTLTIAPTIVDGHLSDELNAKLTVTVADDLAQLMLYLQGKNKRSGRQKSFSVCNDDYVMELIDAISKFIEE